MKVVAALTCRAESSRLYGKPLQMVGDRPILEHLIDRLRRVAAIDKIVLAIGDTPSQAIFVEQADRLGVPYVVGDESDVLGRLIGAAELLDADTVVRVTTENPYVYWENLDTLIGRHHQTGASLTVTEDLPVGAAVEVSALTAYRQAYAEMNAAAKERGPSLYLVSQPDRFRIDRIPAPDAVRAPQFRITVDGPEDLMLARAVWQALSRPDHLIAVEEIVRLLSARPDLAAMNAHLRTPYVWHSAGAVPAAGGAR